MRTRQEVYREFEKHALLPLFNEGDLDLCKKVIEACYLGGVRLFEFTNRSKHALDTFQALVPFVQSKYPDLVLGAGTIMNETDALLFHKAGAEFLVSPIFSREVGNYAERNQLFWCPGTATLTEIVESHTMGADLVKIFPAGLLGGPKFLEAIKGPCPWVRIMPTGGVDGTEESLRGWFKAGAVCVGLGSQLFTKELIAKKDFAAIQERTSAIVNIIRKIKSPG